MKHYYVVEKNSVAGLKNWLPAWAVMAVIFMLSSLSGQTINDAGLGRESYHINGHFLMFFVLCLSFYKATKSIGLAFIFTVIYAFLDEFHQYFVPLRSVSTKDIITDVFAALMASVFLWKLSQLLPNKLKIWLNN